MIIREIILDTETTGLSPLDGHRIVEIGAVELINHLPTGKTFHVYLNPERDMPKEAEAIHGLSGKFLSTQAIFKTVLPDFIEFIATDKLIIHNASFDIAFINAELRLCDQPTILNDRVVDTLMLARKLHPAGPNSLDALCRRYSVDNSKRTKHGALLDAELLAEVYLHLVGGRQTNLILQPTKKADPAQLQAVTTRSAPRSKPLAERLSQEERAAHSRATTDGIQNSIWSSLA